MRKLVTDGFECGMCNGGLLCLRTFRR